MANVQSNVISLLVDDGTKVEDSVTADVTATKTKSPLYIGGKEGEV